MSLLAFVQIKSTCEDHERSNERRTPKYLKVSTYSSGLLFKVNCACGLTEFRLREIIVVLHLVGLSVRSPSHRYNQCPFAGGECPQLILQVCTAACHLHKD